LKPAGHTPLPPRRKSHGVAVLELALSLIFLVPLLAGMLDFGYFFYVSSTAEEAAHAGVRQAVFAGGGGCPNVATATDVQRVATSTGANCTEAIGGNGGDAACYMNQPPLNLGGLPTGATGGTTVTTTCNAAVVDPTWTVSVQVDFPLAYGFFRGFFVQSTIPACTNCVRYTATATGTP
jgi:Flp pilus assembly protein TadG